MATPQKAYLQRVRDDGVTPHGPRLQVMFNPTQFSISKASQFAEINVPGLTAPLQQFVRLQAARLSVELFFDSTDTGMDRRAKGIVKETDKFYDLIKIDSIEHAPPVCRFVWGYEFPGGNPTSNQSQRSPHFVGVIESIEQQFTLFSPKGIPLRATLTVSMREYKTLATQRQELRLSSPDRTHAHVVQRGDTLSSIATRYYADPGAWRPLAEENGITDPRRLVPGTVLRVPPTDRRRLAAGVSG